MILHTYESSPLTDGWTCNYCGVPLGDLHHVNPEAQDGAFCSPGCAEESARHAGHRMKHTRQVALAL